MPHRVLEFQPSPPWGRGWLATGAFSSRGETGEGVQTSSSSTVKRHCAWCPAKLHRRARSKRHAASSDSICFAVPALAVDTSELGRTGCSRWIHGLDPLTRRAPADENAGCAPPSPPRGRGSGMHNGHSSEDAAYLLTDGETPVSRPYREAAIGVRRLTDELAATESN
jgi:hypothetical protein